MNESPPNLAVPHLRNGGRLPRASIVGVLLALSVILIACGAGGSEDDGGSSVTGVIVDVRGTISEVETFELALADGSRITLEPEAGALERSGFSPAHLREHMALVEPISVTYREEGDRNVMTGIDD